MLPSDPGLERMVLGAILASQGKLYLEAAAQIGIDDFSTEAHRRIWARMAAIAESGQAIDRVTVGHDLHGRGELESVGGLSYLVSLDDGMPEVVDMPSYAARLADKGLRRRMIHAHHVAISRCETGTESAHEILAETEQKLLALDTGETSGLVSPGEILDRYPDGVNAFLDPSKRERGLPTGFAKLDELTEGLHPGELFILAARPSVGKTALAMNIATHVALYRRRGAAVFSLEMSKEALLTRVMCSEARVDSQRHRHGYLSHDDRRALTAVASKLAQAPLYIDDKSAASVIDIHARVKKHTQRVDVGLVVVDYLQLMMAKGKWDSRVQEVSAITRGLKLAAKDLGIPFLVLSQLSRACEERQEHKPQLSDLRDSGSIEQDADLVAFIFREEMYRKDREDLKGKAELILAKQRNGPTGTIPLSFIAPCTRFENPPEQFERTEERQYAEVDR